LIATGAEQRSGEASAWRPRTGGGSDGAQPLGRHLLQLNHEVQEKGMRGNERGDRMVPRIELLNARWHKHRQGSGFGRCAVCGSNVSAAVLAVYRDGEVLHADCASFRPEPT
jgi:hypothetical protein